MIKLKNLNQDIFIRYLLKKGVIRKSINYLEESVAEIKEFQAMFRRLINSQKEIELN